MKVETVVDSIKDLSSIAEALNKKSDELNSTITALNEKLATLNLGIEAWVEWKPIQRCDWERYDENDKRVPPFADAYLLGYAYCFETRQWEICYKKVRLVEVNPETDRPYRVESIGWDTSSLLKASRDLRIAAIEVIPDLLDLLELEAEQKLEAIEQAKQRAERL